MADFPALPPVEEAPEVLDGGHLWLQERVDGFDLRFSVESGGWLAFGGPDGPFRDETPPRYRPAVRHVRETIDWDVLGDVPDGVVFYGVATTFRRITYDWERLPPFLGVDVRSGEDLLAPDAAERAFRHLGLAPANAFQKEVAARHFALDSYDLPDSDWWDGPPLGVIVRNKAGGRALLSTPGFEPTAPEPPADDPVAVAEGAATAERIEAAIRDLGDGRSGLDFDAVRERAVDRVLRERWGAIAAPDRPLDPDAVVEAIETAVREYLLAERPDLVGDGSSPG